MAMPLLSIAAILSQAILVSCNTEKSIFLGPGTVNIPNQLPTLESLHLEVLDPVRGTAKVRTHLEAQFPTEDRPEGKATWTLLDSLTEGQRYELRVCWAATQPTAFTLHTHELPAVWETPELMSSLYDYSMSRQAEDGADDVEKRQPRAHGFAQEVGGAEESEKSLLFLQIMAAADYFTTNATLMENVPPVYVDIILDPYLFNILPQSLAPTAAYVVFVAAVSFFIAKRAVASLHASILCPERTAKDKKIR